MNETIHPIQVGIYVRVSTEDQDTELQERELVAEAERRGWVHFVYKDQGISGAKFNRPMLNTLLTHIREGRIQVVLAWKLDRIGRSTQHLAEIINILLEANCGLVVPSQGIDTSAGSINPASKLQLNVLAAVAEFERDLIRERTLDGLARAKAQGKVGGRRPTIAGQRAQLVKRLAAEGQSIREIAASIEASPSAVHRLLSRATTAGAAIHG